MKRYSYLSKYEFQCLMLSVMFYFKLFLLNGLITNNLLKLYRCKMKT